MTKCLLLLSLLAGLASCAVESPTEEASAALITAADCEAHAVGKKVTICHRTRSAINPFVEIKVAKSACLEGHGGHIEDFIAVNGSCADVISTDLTGSLSSETPPATTPPPPPTPPTSTPTPTPTAPPEPESEPESESESEPMPDPTCIGPGGAECYVRDESGICWQICI